MYWGALSKNFQAYLTSKDEGGGGLGPKLQILQTFIGGFYKVLLVLDWFYLFTLSFTLILLEILVKPKKQ
jgi:hypothetical protein